MAPKTEEQWTCVCDGLFLNDTKPQEWKQDFPWKPSIGFHFRVLDDSGSPIEETHKKYLKDMWLFQAMGGKNAKGHYFKLQVEHGEVPAKDGKPAQPYTSVMPIAEVFEDGTARFLEPPKEGKVTTPASPKPGAPLKTGTPGVKPKVEAEEAQIVTDRPKVDRNTAKAEGFFKGLDVPQSDFWWMFKTHLGFDGADAVNTLDFAKHIALMEMNNVEEGTDLRVATKAAIDYWCDHLGTKMRQLKFQNIRTRLVHYLSLCQSDHDLDKVLSKAWCELPESDFKAIRALAVERRKTILAETKEGIFMGKIQGTLQPEAEFEVRDGDLEEKTPVEKPQAPPQAQAAPSGPDPAIVDSTVKAFDKLKDWPKLLNFWNTTAPIYQKVPEVVQAFQAAIMEILMTIGEQAVADPIIAGIPGQVLTADFKTMLDSRYKEMIPF